MNEAQMPERIFVRTEDNIHHITGWGKLATHFNPTIDTEYIRKNLSVSDGWIDVKERVPEKNGFLAYHPKWGIREGALFSGGVTGHWAGDDLATHWMPLPSPPKDSPVSDGLEHSQHNDDCLKHEEILDRLNLKVNNMMDINKAYREALEETVDHLRRTDGSSILRIAISEVLTRMESHKLPEVK